MYSLNAYTVVIQCVHVTNMSNLILIPKEWYGFEKGFKGNPNTKYIFQIRTDYS